jgi:adenylate cyclase
MYALETVVVPAVSRRGSVPRLDDHLAGQGARERGERLVRDALPLQGELFDPKRGFEAPVSADPVVREVSVLFTDLRGFTPLAEEYQAHPEQLLEVVNAHLAAIVPSITWVGGVVEKFLGDGLMATFGARNSLVDDAGAAVEAALGVVAANEALNRRWAATWGFSLEVGVAAARGRVALGVLGAPERWEHGMLGDPVNVAARLVERAAPGEVLLTEGIRRGLRGLPASLVAQIAVRGRRQAIQVYRIAASGRAATLTHGA